MTKITFTIALTVEADALPHLAAAGRAAAADSFDTAETADHEDSWNAYRARYTGGPIAADLNELVATMFAEAMPLGGYEFDTDAFRIADDAPAASNEGGVIPNPQHGQVKGYPVIAAADVGRRIRITKVQDPDEVDLVGRTGTLAHPFPGQMLLPRENYVAGINLDEPSAFGHAINLERGDEFEFV